VNFIHRLRWDIHSSTFLLAIVLSLSTFTSLWNPLEYPVLSYDESTYIGRAMHVLVAKSPQEGTFYDHPYFGQLFLAGIFWIIGYPNSLHPSASGDVIDSVYNLWLVPKLLIGIIGVIDTFLVYKISERMYNTKVAFFASIIFAVMPIILFLRTIFLESLQLPFLLSSIWFAVYAKDTTKNNNNRRYVCMMILSGIFMGLAIFTKISVFIMIPLIVFLIFKTSNKKIKAVSIWFIPVILIPLIWPSYAFVHSDFDRWWDAVFWQTHRQLSTVTDISKQNSPLNALVKNFIKEPILIGVGLAGLAFAAIKRDFFMLLWIAPFLVFLYVIGFVRDFHLIPVLPALSISAARLIDGLSKYIVNKKLQEILPFAIILAIAIFGLINVMTLFSNTNNDDEIASIALVSKYLQDNNNDNITMISQHVYSWIPKYVFHLGNEYLIPELTHYETPRNEKVLMVVDHAFRDIMYGNDPIGKHLMKVYKEHTKNATTVFEDANDKIILPQP